jgi:hypothetical protein
VEVSRGAADVEGADNAGLAGREVDG